jgi:hypothetical protein
MLEVLSMTGVSRPGAARVRGELRPAVDGVGALARISCSSKVLVMGKARGGETGGKKSAAFDPAMLEDHYRNALVRILRKKQAKMPAPPAPVAPSRENVINLMDALRRSIAAEPPAKKSAAASKAARAKRRSPMQHR